MSKFKKGDLVRWKAALRVDPEHLGIVLEERALAPARYKVQWFTDNNNIGNHPEAMLTKVEDEGEYLKVLVTHRRDYLVARFRFGCECASRVGNRYLA